MRLNEAQQAAVNHIYGPLLVLAGPGTGKTQLLSARTANILKVTDANPQNILCLTFTENAAHNMRERLNTIIGPDAYSVHIGTYHSFGSDIITSYPQYFESVNIETNKDSRLEKPIDDLQKIQVLSKIVNSLPYSSPLIGAKRYIKSLASTISELKRGLYTPQSLQALAKQNLDQIDTLSPKISDTLGATKRVPSKADSAIEFYSGLVAIFEGQGGLAGLAHDELEHALAEASDIGKSKPLTEWKNNWLTKNEDDYFQFSERFRHERMMAMAGVFEAYQEALSEAGLFDFDDMILRAIDTLKEHDDLRFTLQEKYQFILLDEFQDTNAAQYELVRLLTDNPVNEGKPNVFAVGDDDQAIYAFQGAKLSNMLTFTKDFEGVAVINLTENYRSHADVLSIAENISSQLSTRLHHNLDGISKQLASHANTKASIIERVELSSKSSEYGWVSNRIQELLTNGTDPSEIAVITPKHSLLEELVPFCIDKNIPVSYERRENILDTKLVRAIELMIKLLAATSEGDTFAMNELFPRVLSLDFYNVSPLDIWQINWQIRTRDETRTWAEIAVENDDLAPHVLFFLQAGLQYEESPLEFMLDQLIGTMAAEISDDRYRSPLKEYYFNAEQKNLQYYESLSHLSAIREQLRTYQGNSEAMLHANDFIRFTESYKVAEMPLIDTHPINTADNAVQFMTAYKAKGLEFEHVFILSAHDDVWGTKARSNSNKITLPQNLQHIRYQGSGEDELIRLLFVAVTRAKAGLHITSHEKKDTGKQNEAIKFMLESEDQSNVLPEHSKTVQKHEYEQDEALKQVELLWEGRHLAPPLNLKAYLKDRVQRYQLSPTHVNTITDTEYGGWDVFVLGTLLRFPQAPGEDGEFGNAIHETLDWLQKEQAKNGTLPAMPGTLKIYEAKLARRYIPDEKMDDYTNRGRKALTRYIEARSDMLNLDSRSEVDFRKEGVLVGEAHLTGKIDRIEVDTQTKTLRIIDFKTGTPETKWYSSPKLKKYKQQLYFYKILIEKSHTWAGYTVEDARLEFVELNSNGDIVPPLVINFKDIEEEQLKELIQVIWQAIQKLEEPQL